MIRRRIKSILSCLFLITLFCTDLGNARVAQINTIDAVFSPERIRRDVFRLADPSLMFGRGTGQPGYEMARDFLARELRSLGYQVTIQSFVVSNSYSPRTGEVNTIYSSNVIGVLRGSAQDSSAVLFSAHADHVGIREGIVYSGADDNASGVAAVLAIARAFSAMRRQDITVERSIMICFFGAEETVSMIGSQHFLSSRYFTRWRPVALLNFDMVGRGGLDSVVVMGSLYNRAFGRESPTLFQMVQDLNTEGLVIPNLDTARTKFLSPNLIESFNKSDHWNFYNRGIPVLFFFTGLHSDYHRPTDTADRIDYNKLSRISRLGFRIGFRIASSNIWPAFALDPIYIR